MPFAFGGQAFGATHLAPGPGGQQALDVDGQRRGWQRAQVRQRAQPGGIGRGQRPDPAGLEERRIGLVEHRAVEPRLGEYPQRVGMGLDEADETIKDGGEGGVGQCTQCGSALRGRGGGPLRIGHELPVPAVVDLAAVAVDRDGPQQAAGQFVARVMPVPRQRLGEAPEVGDQLLAGLLVTGTRATTAASTGISVSP